MESAGRRRKMHGTIKSPTFAEAESAMQDEEPNAKKRRRQSSRSQETLPVSPRPSLSQNVNQMYASEVRCGKVLQIHLTNFMCHANMKFKFHPRVNFMVGSNGSGKSAILAALVLGLGAKARDTNRSSNMQQYIKTGETSAKIEITISNNGPQAFEPAEYGERITIVRNISQHSGTYIIKNCSGNVVSRKAADLQRILMYHNVQVDNPVFVLNQDNSRSLLKDLEPTKNYELFLKATQIETVNEYLMKCALMQRGHLRQLELLKRKLDKNNSDFQELEKKLQLAMSVEGIEELLSKCKVERLWLVVSQREEALAVVQQDLNRLNEERSSLHYSVTQKGVLEEQLTKTIRQIENDIKTQSSMLQDENSAYMQLESKVKQLHEQSEKHGGGIDSCKKRISRLQSQIKDLCSNVEERTSNGPADIASLRLSNETQLTELRQRLNDNAKLMETAGQDLSLYRNNKQQLDGQMQKLCQQKEEHSKTRMRLNAQISNIRVSSSDQLSIYGRDVPPLLQEIDRWHKAGRFSAKPLGPIGRYIEVPNAQYRDVVEDQLKSLLQAYIVNTTKDRCALLELMRQKFPHYKANIITTPFLDRVYDVSKGCVVPPLRGMRLLMSEIKCKNPVVMNCLIDRASIETILLADTPELAEKITADSQNVVPNLLKVIVASAGLMYHPDPHYRMYSMNIRPARFIQRNVEDRIRQLEQDNEIVMEKITSMEENISTSKSQLSGELHRIEQQKAMVQSCEARKTELEEKIEELENYEYPHHDEVHILKAELAENEAQLKLGMERLAAKMEEQTAVLLEHTLCVKQLQEQGNVMLNIQTKISAQRTAREKTINELSSLDNKHLQRSQKLTKLDQQKDELSKQQSDMQEEIQQASRTAAQHGERVQITRNEEALQEEIKELEAKLKKRAHMTRTPAELRELIMAKELSITADRKQYQNSELTYQKLKAALLQRATFVNNLKRHMAMLLWHSFHHCCKLRGYEGNLDVDHSEKQLTISVRPRDKEESAVSSTKSLSGGERSYATVAFLISLWSCVDHPFYFLDEYDVFTDEVNREFMTRLLINEGKTRPDRQYVFLTPQALALQQEDFINILKLSKPDRQ